MIARLEAMTNYYTNFKILIFLFIPLLVLVTLLVFTTKIGLIILVGAVLFTTILLKPKIIYFLLISLFSIEGFGTLPGTSAAKLLGILFMIGLTLRLAMTKEVLPKDSSYKYFYLFFAGSIVSFAFAKDLSISLQIYVTYVSLFFLYIFTRIFLRNIKDIHYSINFLIVSGLIAAAFTHFMGVTVHSGWLARSRDSGGLADPNEYASYIMALIPLVFYKVMSSSRISKKSFYWSSLFIFFMLLVLSGSRGGIVGFLGAISVLLYYYGVGRMKQIALLLVIIITIASFFVPDAYWTRISTITNPKTEQGSSIKTRIDNYRAAVKMFLDYPIAGVGLYNFQFKSREYGASGGKVVHNTYLEILTGGGLLSFLPFLVILIKNWHKLGLRTHYPQEWRDLLICLKASFVSLLLTSFFISADHKKILFFLLALISSAYYILSSKARPDAKSTFT